MSLIRRARGASEARALTKGDNPFLFGDDLDGGGTTASGVRVSPLKAQQLTAVHACHRVISTSISTLPVGAYIKDVQTIGDKSVSVRRPFHPRPTWLERPNPEDTTNTYFERLLRSLLTDGNAYALKSFDRFGDVLELIPVHPDTVTVDRDPDTNHRRYKVAGYEGYFAPYEILHIPAFINPGDLVGHSPIRNAADAIGLGLAAEEFGARFFANGASMSGVLETDGELVPEAREAAAAAFSRRHTGLANAHKPAVLTHGLKWKALTVKPEEAQWLELRRFQVIEIARLYGVPPHLIGAVETSTSWGTGIEVQMRGFYQLTLLPWIERLEQAHSALLPGKAFVKFNLDGLLRGTSKERAETYRLYREMGVMSANDVAAKEDLPPVPGGDTYDNPYLATPKWIAEGDDDTSQE